MIFSFALLIGIGNTPVPNHPIPLVLPADINTKIEHEGSTYRVRVKGRSVSVYDKAAAWRLTPENMVKMIAAAERVTACEVKLPHWNGNHLAGILECPSSNP